MDVWHLGTGKQAGLNIEDALLRLVESMQAFVPPDTMADVHNHKQDFPVWIALRHLMYRLRIQELMDRVRLGKVPINHLVELNETAEFGQCLRSTSRHVRRIICRDEDKHFFVKKVGIQVNHFAPRSFFGRIIYYLFYKYSI